MKDYAKLLFLLAAIVLLIGCAQKKINADRNDKEALNNTDAVSIDNEVKDLDSNINADELDSLDSDLDNIDW